MRRQKNKDVSEKRDKMPNINTPSELQGWEELDQIAGGDSVPVQNKIKIETARKTVLATTNLGNNIFLLQKVLGKRLDDLNEKLESASKSSDEQSKRMFWLTIALVVATIIQSAAAVTAVVIATKS